MRIVAPLLSVHFVPSTFSSSLDCLPQSWSEMQVYRRSRHSSWLDRIKFDQESIMFMFCSAMLLLQCTCEKKSRNKKMIIVSKVQHRVGKGEANRRKEKKIKRIRNEWHWHMVFFGCVVIQVVVVGCSGRSGGSGDAGSKSSRIRKCIYIKFKYLAICSLEMSAALSSSASLLVCH